MSSGTISYNIILPFILSAPVSHWFSKLWRTLFWGSKNSIVQLFDGEDGLIDFRLQEKTECPFSLPSGDRFRMLSCAGPVIPEVLGSLCKDSQKYCKCAFSGLHSDVDVEQRQTQSPASGRQHSVHQGRSGTACVGSNSAKGTWAPGGPVNLDSAVCPCSDEG